METNALLGQNFCTTSGLLTATGGVTTYDTTVAITYALGGKAKVKATVAGGATPTTDGVSGAAITMVASQGRCVVWCLDTAGVVKCVAGAVVPWDGTAFLIPPPFPDIPDTLVPFAYQILKTSSAAGTITFGTSNWNATGFTNVIQNVLVLPSRPQVS
jgi:hypothetical protein